ncbi:MAG: hypothetical protein WAM85_17190, partial [Terracidiphilus sp.]
LHFARFSCLHDEPDNSMRWTASLSISAATNAALDSVDESKDDQRAKPKARSRTSSSSLLRAPPTIPL